jgi:lipid-A-disaccharide synthase-like uncharacterized protein
MLAAVDAPGLITKLSHPLVVFGLAGQVVFMLRFVVQWFVSERLGRSHVPIAFWHLSLIGGIMLLIYGLLDVDPVIVLGQTLGLGIYVRNLVLIYRRRARLRRTLSSSGAIRDSGA